MADIKIAVDADNAMTQIEKLTKVVNQYSASIDTAKLASVRYNEQGEIQNATVRGLDATGQKYSATLKQVGKDMQVMSLQYQNADSEAKKLLATQKEQERKLGDLSKGVNQLSETFNRFVTYKVLNLITDALKEGTSAARDYQVQISLIRTISQDSQQSFASWSSSVKKVSDDSGLGIASVSKAAYDAVSNQVAKGQAVFPFLKEAADLAKTTGGTIDQAGNLLASAMNSYGLSVGEAQKLSALFFYTIDEGRVKLGDMSDTFGRVGILGKGLGVTIEELAGSVAFLTQKGVTTDDAFTFLKNVFIQMEKPSEQLMAFFRSIGVESGKAAIQTYGFIEVLNKINRLVKSGDGSVAKLFPEIRAQQPIQAALNDIEGYNAIVNKAADTAKRLEVYQKAIDITAESPADFINKEFNKIKNTFTVDVGQQLLDMSKKVLIGFKDLSRAFTGKDSLSDGLDFLVITVRNLTIAFVAYRTGVGASTIATLAYSAATSKATVSTVAFNAATRASIIGLGVALVSFAASKLLFSDSLKSDLPLFDHYTDGIKAMREEAIKANAVKIEPIVNKDFEEKNKAAIQNTLQVLAQFSIQATESINKARAAVKEGNKDFELSFHSFADSLKNTSNELERRIQASKQMLKDIQKSTDNFKDSFNETIDNLAEENLVGGNKTDFLNKKINVLVDRAKEQFAKAASNKSTPEDATEALREGEKYIKLIQDAEVKKFQNFLQIIKANRQAIEANNPQERKWDETDYHNAALQQLKTANNVIDFGQSTLEKQLNDLWKFRLDIVKQVNDEKTKQIDIDKKALAEQKKNQEDLQNKFKAFNDFTPFDKDNQVSKEYIDPVSKKVNTAAIERDQEAKKQDFLKSIAANGGPVNQQVQLVDFVNNRDRAFKVQTAELIKKNSIDSATQEYNTKQRQFEESTKKEKDSVKAAAGTQETLLSSLAKTTVDAEKLKHNVANTANDFTVPFTGRKFAASDVKAALYDFFDDPTTNFDRSKRPNAPFENKLRDADYVRQAGEDVKAKLRAANETKVNLNGINVSRPEDIIALTNSVEDLAKALETQGKSQFGDNYKDQIIPGSENKTYGETIAFMRKQAQELGGTGFNSNQGFWNEENLKKKHREEMGPIEQQIKEIDPSAWNKVTLNNQQQLGIETGKTAVSMNNLNTAIQNLKLSITESNKNRVTPQDNNIDNLPRGNEPKAAPNALGGWIGAASSRIGPDKYLTALGDGEFVMNAESSSIFANELNYMNKVRRGSPTSSVLGGNTSNNVGDITVIVNEAKTGQETGRQVWTKIKRELRRGNIK